MDKPKTTPSTPTKQTQTEQKDSAKAVKEAGLGESSPIAKAK